MHREKVWVDVETAFPDGFVVSFTDECGAEYRGALLKQTNAPPLVNGPNLKLANPLSLLHDHPYAKIQKFGKKVCREVPAKVLLGWSTAGLSQTPSHAVSTRNGFVINQRKHKMIAVVESGQSTSEDQHRERGGNRPFFRHEHRNAKLLATLKMQSGSEKYSVQTLTNAFSKTSYSLQPKKRKPKVVKRLEGRKQKMTALSVSIQPETTKSSTSPGVEKHSSSSVTTQAYSTGSLQSVSKDSIPVVQCSNPCTPAKLARSTCTVDISPTKLHHRVLSTGQFSSSPPATLAVPEQNSRVPEVPNSPLPVGGSSPAVALKCVKTFSIPLKKITTLASPSPNTPLIQ